MRNTLFVVIMFFTMSSFVYGQKVEITPQYGYQIGAKYNYYGGYLKIEGSDQYGLTFGINANDDITVEFMWAQQNSSLELKISNFILRKPNLVTSWSTIIKLERFICLDIVKQGHLLVYQLVGLHLIQILTFMTELQHSLLELMVD